MIRNVILHFNFKLSYSKWIWKWDRDEQKVFAISLLFVSRWPYVLQCHAKWIHFNLIWHHWSILFKLWNLNNWSTFYHWTILFVTHSTFFFPFFFRIFETLKEENELEVKGNILFRIILSNNSRKTTYYLSRMSYNIQRKKLWIKSD